MDLLFHVEKRVIGAKSRDFLKFLMRARWVREAHDGDLVEYDELSIKDLL